MRILSRRDFIENWLRDGLWHTTSAERFVSISMSQAILAEPPIDDCERQKTSAGPSGYPYVRSLGGISLFDFTAFDEDHYGQKCPSSSWANFVPIWQEWPSAVWIEIDRTQLGTEFIDGQSLLARWKSGGQPYRAIMPYIEAACVGDIAMSKALRSFEVFPDGPNQWRVSEDQITTSQ